jgi:hypothetical protein
MKACKIDRAANHHHLTNPQLRGWARSLVRFTRGRGRGTRALTSTPTSKTPNLWEVDLHLTSETSKVWWRSGKVIP